MSSGFGDLNSTAWAPFQAVPAGDGASPGAITGGAPPNPAAPGGVSPGKPQPEREEGWLQKLGSRPLTAGPPPHLQNFGGRILDRPSFYSVYLGKFWSSAGGKELAAHLNSFAKALFSSSYMGVWREYSAGKGRFLGSSGTATRMAPRLIHDDDIQRRLSSELLAGKLPPSDGQTVYTVYLPPGAVVEIDGRTSDSGIGGYHSSFDMLDGTRIYYAVIVYSDSQNGANITGNVPDNLTVAASHEWTEAVTDPDVNNGRLGWYDRVYGEIGDIPIEIARTRQEVYGDVAGYATQKEWSNREGRSVLAPAKETRASTDERRMESSPGRR